jgi:hypothetical protein
MTLDDYGYASDSDLEDEDDEDDVSQTSVGDGIATPGGERFKRR